MSWGRIDDGFTNHPKILALGSHARRWTWLEVLTYSWRYRSPLIPDAISSVVRGATPKYLDDCETLGLVDRDDQGRRQVHDWPIYSGETIGEKVNYYLTRNPDASANEVVRAIGGTREIVLHEVARFRSEAETHTPNGSKPGSVEPQSVPDPPVRSNHQTGTESGSETGSRARAPVPSPTPTPKTSTSSVSENDLPFARADRTANPISVSQTIKDSLALAAKEQPR